LVGVDVRVRVEVGVGVDVDVGLSVSVGVAVGVLVLVAVGVVVGVAVALAVGVMVGVLEGAGSATLSRAANASSKPKPESRSTPAASMSRAVEVNAVRSCAVVRPGTADFNSAAMAAAWGAAAEVPQNGSNPGAETLTQSAAARSGFCRTVPPVDEKFPGVIAVPLARKNTRRGPSEL
jgi:hypothetical protein